MKPKEKREFVRLKTPFPRCAGASEASRDGSDPSSKVYDEAIGRVREKEDRVVLVLLG